MLADPSRREANGQAIAESFGFCHADAAALLGLYRPKPVPHSRRTDLDRSDPGEHVRSVLRLAARYELKLLARGPDRERRLLGLMLRAARACPACHYAERRVAGVLSQHAAKLRAGERLPRICLPHFRSLIGKSRQADLRAWIRLEADSLRAAPRAETSMPLVAGRPKPAAATTVAAPMGWRCSVCAAVQRAHGEWLEDAKTAVHLGLAEWNALPACPEHLWDCARAGDGALARRAAEHALDTALATLERADAWLESEDRRLALESRSVWHKPKSPAYLLGRRRKVLRALWNCAACERLVAAAERAAGRLCEDLAAVPGREGYERSGGVCMQHFAQACLIAPDGPVRATLIGVQSAKLRELECALGRRDGPWQDALLRFCPSPMSQCKVLAASSGAGAKGQQ